MPQGEEQPGRAVVCKTHLDADFSIQPGWRVACSSRGRGVTARIHRLLQCEQFIEIARMLIERSLWNET
jgi:hypothetical protein